ncbi:hypothetical protein AJ80_05215 [Polytolypa hystricis UAMH7299]|uniref:Something about silencing protein 4 domain-containing protein n=1 Tax=Polytolypa hystricis (strain UAMH7299) TaxID=1447883 RepID=A0A2B7Y5A2_POLH7|nr:hypothetical protein AJ80_05215 [Polytolypa hystricis UAMH7299]
MIAPTLRFSVRHRDAETASSSPPPPPAEAATTRTTTQHRIEHDPRPKFASHQGQNFPTSSTARGSNTNNNPPPTKTTTTARRKHAIIPQPPPPSLPHLQSQSPTSLLVPTPPPPSRILSHTTVSGHERPLKRAKLDGGQQHDDPPTSSESGLGGGGGGSAAAAAAKLPLRNRDEQTTATTTTGGGGTTGTRTRPLRGSTLAATATATARTNVSSPLASGPPRIYSPPTSAINRYTRKAASNNHNMPDAEGKLGSAVQSYDDNTHRHAATTAASALYDGSVGGAAPPTQRDAATGGLSAGRERRSLRSNDGGSRSKSELAMYFQNYEQIISLEPVKPEFLSTDTTVILIDDLTEPLDIGKFTNGHSSQTEPHDNPLFDLYQTEVIDLPSTQTTPAKDPLGDDVYFKAHRRIERQEKQLRNIEKERAQHEKIQLERLLDELQGHDWLRVMGISGITDTEKKLYEPKRAYFIKEVSALVDKFRVWKEEEKRRRLAKEQMLAEEDEEEDSEDEEDDSDEEGEEEEHEEEQDEPAEPKVRKSRVDAADTRPQTNGELSPDAQSGSEPPDSSDVDAWAARQLHQEAILASSSYPTKGTIPPPSPQLQSQPSSSSKPNANSKITFTQTKLRFPTVQHSVTSHPHPSHSPSPQPQSPQPPPSSSSPPPPPAEPEPDQPFTSFFSKRHLRDAALGKIRRAGRTRMAFGEPLPDMPEDQEFQLPGDILNEEAILACQRKKRRLRRLREG